MRFQLICCEVLYREMCDAIAHAPHQVDVRFLPKGLHDLGGARMRRELQRAVDEASVQECDAVLMGYALCGNGLHDLRAARVPLVVPRAHDCITLLMGGRKRYQHYFEENPGTYFRSTGWLERGKNLAPLMRLRTGVDVSLEALIAKYGDDNGRYLFEELTRYRETYSRLTFIETGLEPDERFADEARQEATERHWQFDMIRGDLRLCEALVSGVWPEDEFVVAQPGERLVAKYDERIIDREPARDEE